MSHCSSARVAWQAELRAQHALRCCPWRSWRPRAVSAQTSPIEASLGNERRSTRDVGARVGARVGAQRMSVEGRDRVLGRSAGASERLGKLRRMEALLLTFFQVEKTQSVTGLTAIHSEYRRLEERAVSAKGVFRNNSTAPLVPRVRLKAHYTPSGYVSRDINCFDRNLRLHLHLSHIQVGAERT